MATSEAGKRELRFGGRLTSTSMREGLGGLLLIILGVLSLRSINAILLNSIATIIAGVVLISVSGSLSLQLGKELAARSRETLDASQLRSGMNAGALAGLAGVVLGILSILGRSPAVLTAVAVIAFGAAVLFDYVAHAQLRALRMTSAETSDQAARLALPAASSTSTATVLIGVALITLGVLAVTGTNTNVLVAVALLSLGSYLFLESTAIVAYMMSWAT